MGEKMEHRGAIGRDTGGEEHVAELAAGRIGDYPLDVVLHQADCGGEKRRKRPHESDDGKSNRRVFEHG